MPDSTITIVESHPREQLPLPATTYEKGRINVQSSAAPLIALCTGLAAISSQQPRAVLLFIGAGTVIILGFYFVAPPKDDENTHPIMSAFLHKLPNVFTAVGCALIVLGIAVAFPNDLALVPLFAFIFFAALAALFGMALAVWITAFLYGAALISLVTFVVLAFTT